MYKTGRQDKERAESKQELRSESKNEQSCVSYIRTTVYAQLVGQPSTTQRDKKREETKNGLNKNTTKTKIENRVAIVRGDFIALGREYS